MCDFVMKQQFDEFIYIYFCSFYDLSNNTLTVPEGNDHSQITEKSDHGATS